MLNPGQIDSLAELPPVTIVDAFNLGSYDTVELTQDATHDIWSYKLSGVHTYTITITYTDSGKATISSVVRT